MKKVSTQKNDSKKSPIRKKLKTRPLKAGKNKILKIGVVTARFNFDITEQLEDGALTFLEETGCEIFSVRVPGAVEIPLAAQALFDHHNVDGIVALGAVIRGETTHYEEVCRSVERNCSRLMLDYKKPIGFGVLTTENEEQAMDRVGGKHGHKGVDAAQAVLEMIGLLSEIKKK
jgi:6,7-dimethyl-8-ribityllumazine synthase